MSSLRDKILAASDISSETVEVPEWDATVEVRSLSVRARAKLFDAIEGDDVDVEKLYPDLVIASAYDPESGEPVFTPDDRDVILDKSAGAVDRIAQKAMRLSGMSEEALKDAENFSESDQSNSTGTS